MQVKGTRYKLMLHQEDVRTYLPFTGQVTICSTVSFDIIPLP